MGTAETSGLDLNKGDDEKFKSYKYKVNPKKFFWDTINKLRGKA